MKVLDEITKNVLIVEDDSDLSFVTKIELEKHDYEVKEVRDAKEAQLVDAELKIQGLRKELFKSEENLRHFQRRQKDNPLDKIE